MSGPSDTPLFAWGDALRAAKARRRRGLRRSFVGAVGSFALLAAFPPTPRLLWNASASAPTGLYAVSPGGRAGAGDMVVARLPGPYRRLAATRRYLPLNVPLVKRAAASAGDKVCAFGTDVFVNKHRVAKRLRLDGSGRPMPLWSGCALLHGHQLFLLMDTPASFDGRYFGVTEGTDVIGTARLLWSR